MTEGVGDAPAGAAISTTIEVLEGLNDLLQLDHDAVSSYAIAIERLENREYALQIQGFRKDHERHIRKLNAVILDLGGVPLNEPHPTAPLKDAIQKIASAGGDRILLAAWRTNELQVRSTYDDYARKAVFWPAEAKRVIDENALDEERHYEWVVGRLDAGGGDSQVTENLREGLARARKKTAEAQGQLGRAASAARLGAAAGLESAADRLARIAEEARGSEGVRAQAAEGAQRLAHGFESTASFLRHTGRAEIEARAEEEIRSNPARSLGVTFAIGFIVGRILR